MSTENQAVETSAPKKAKKEKVQVTLSAILADLKAGLNRAALAEKYGLSKAAMKRMFKNNPKLQGKKASFSRTKSDEESFVLIDDTETVADNVEGSEVKEGQTVASESADAGVWGNG